MRPIRESVTHRSLASQGFLLPLEGAVLGSSLTLRPIHDLDSLGVPDDMVITAAREWVELPSPG